MAQLRDITFHGTTNDSLIAYSKRVRAQESLDGREDIVLTVVNGGEYYWSGSNYVRLDPHEGRFAHVFNITRL